MNWQAVYPVLPEIALLVMACVVALADLWVPGKDRIVTYCLAQASLGVIALGQLWFFYEGATYYAMQRMVVADPMGHLLGLFATLAMMTTLVYTRPYAVSRDLLKGELFTLSMFSLLGILVMLAANNFLVVYLGLELMSLSLYALVAMRRDDTGATEAAMKYFVLGALASGFLLYGLSMMYGATGSLEISEVFKAIGTGRINRAVLVLGTVFVVAGLAFKLGAVPFHMWVPDVYQGAPTSMTLLVGGAPKLAAFAITIRLLVEGMIGVALDWQQMLVLLSLASMLLGNLAAIAQTNLKRMLAYSTIAQIGFMLLGLCPGVVSGNTVSAGNAYSSAMFYVDHRRADDARHLRHDHAALARRPRGRAHRRLPRPGAAQPLVRRRDGGVHVLARRHPADGRLLRQARRPAGAGLDQRAGLIWLAVAAVVLSLLGAYYYLRVVKVMWFDEPVDAHPIEGTRDVRILLSFNGAAVVVLGIAAGRPDAALRAGDRADVRDLGASLGPPPRP